MHENDPFYRAQLPNIKHAPALKKLKVNPIYLRVQRASGQILKPMVSRVRQHMKHDSASASTLVSAGTLEKAPSIMRMLTERERGIGAKHASFTTAQRCSINNEYTPNSCESLLKLDAKVYCGALSAGGKYFVTATQDNVLRVFDASRGSYERINRMVAKDVQWSILDIAFTSKGDQFAYATWSSCCKCGSVG